MRRLIVIIIIIVLGAIGFFVFKNKETGKLEIEKQETGNQETTETDKLGNSGVAEPEIKKVDADTQAFYHSKYKFSLEFPADVNASNFIEGDGEQILFQNPSGDKWFQIYITPWDEGNNLSVARIRQDLPDLLIENPQNVILGPEQASGVGPQALIFFSEEAGLGETREVWFVNEGYLYQITTFARLDNELAKILSTLIFN